MAKKNKTTTLSLRVARVNMDHSVRVFPRLFVHFLSGSRAAVKGSDTMELAWDAGVFAQHTTCVLCRRMCRLNSFGWGRIYKLTRPFSGANCSESPTPIFTSTPINTESGGREGGRGKADWGGALKAERGAALCECDVCRMDGKHIYFSASFEFDYIFATRHVA